MRHPGVVRRAAAAIAWLSAIVIGIGAAIILDGQRDRLGPADVGVVLGTLVSPVNLPSPRMQARCDRAIEVYRAGLVPTLIVSGGIVPPGRNEARVMRDYLVRQGIPPEHVVEDSTGSNTWLSAAHTRTYLDTHGLTSAMAISQDFHLPRCRLAFTRWGIRPVRTAHARYREWRDVYSTLREIPALVKYALRPWPGEGDR